ncbi:MAG: hypothetical protein AB7N91_01370 [Candidatus Tectimicrobiota bacterium]
MTGAYFVVVFGHGTASKHLEAPQEAAEYLRRLVGTAWQAKAARFQDRVRVSIAPGGVMVAFQDSQPDRAVELCEAVVAQLQHQSTTHLALPPVCAAITHGYMRQIDDPDFGSNFEGSPAIAAARVMAKLAPGECAVERSVWEFSTLLNRCHTAKTVDGKAHDKPFHICIHQHIQFPTQVHSPAFPHAVPAEPPPVRLTPTPEFTQTVRQRLRDILQRPHMQEVREAIVGQGDGTAAEILLAPDQPETLLEAMDRLYHATKNCLARLQQASLRERQSLQHSLREIIGWQALLIMNREQLQAQQLAFHPRQDGLKKEIPLRLEAGIEVLVSSIGERAADFVLKVDNQQRTRVVGRHSFQADELEHGLSPTDQWTGVLQRIWSEVMKPEPPPREFSPDDIGRLQARLKGNERRSNSYYYIAVPPASAHALLVDRVLIERLHQTLPTLRLMYLIGPGQAGILLIDEYDFNEAVETFLRLLEDRDSETEATR